MSNEIWYVRDRNKVTGPFNREQLEAQRRRGTLARFHQVSHDRQNWVPASTLTGLFANPAPPTPVEVAPAPGPAAPPPVGRWYYQNGQDAAGPVSDQALLDLFTQGKLQPATLVWKEGEPDWIELRAAPLKPAAPEPVSPAASIPAPSPKRRTAAAVWIAIGIGAGVGAVVLGLALLVLYQAGFLGQRRGKPIASVTDSQNLAKSVGLVICGCSIVEFDGTRTENCLSTGTCFAVSDQGWLLTNRHVVDDISRFLNADNLRKEIEQKTRMKVDPKIWVFFKNKKYLATIRYLSDNFDLAVLKIEPSGPMPYFQLSSTDEVERGTPVVALGFPGASREPTELAEEIDRFVREKTKGVKIDYHFQKSNLDYVITNGIVSVVRREGRTVKLEHTARISGGNSGGPLVRNDGTVLGINTLIVKENEVSAPTYVALAVAQLREELAQNVPELAQH
jgi:S1-C subfamily serine protease